MTSVWGELRRRVGVVIDARNMAVDQRVPDSELIHHSDRDATT